MFAVLAVLAVVVAGLLGYRLGRRSSNPVPADTVAPMAIDAGPA